MNLRTLIEKPQARFFLGIVLPLSFAVLALACTSPSLTRQTAKDKLEAAKEKQDEGQLEKVKLGVVNVDAGRRALQQDPSPSTNSLVAERRLDSAMTAFNSAGVTPKAEDLIESRKAIDSLLSTNSALYLAASNHFDRLDRVLVSLEKQDKVNRAKVEVLEQKLEKLDRSNAADADALAIIKKWLWWGFFGIIGWAILKLGWQVVEIWGMFNPAVKLGASVVKAPAGVIADGFAELVKGGERFKERISASTEFTPEQQAKIVEWFHSEQKKAQDRDTKDIVEKLTSL